MHRIILALVAYFASQCALYIKRSCSPAAAVTLMSNAIMHSFSPCKKEASSSIIASSGSTILTELFELQKMHLPFLYVDLFQNLYVLLFYQSAAPLLSKQVLGDTI